MNELKRFKYLLQILGICSLILIFFSFYIFGIYTMLSESLNDVSTLIDITKWKRLNYG